MKIVFVQPSFSLDARYGDLSEAGGVEPPFGLCYLAAVTRKMGGDTSIVDAEALGIGFEATKEAILKQKPDIVGITATTPAIYTAGILARQLKEVNPSINVLVGGCHISAIPQETMIENPSFDIGVLGEGERTIERLMNWFKDRRGELGKIPGIIFRNERGELVKTGSAEMIQNLDELPFPAFDMLPDLTKNYHVPAQSLSEAPCLSIITSRGCMGKCTFCDLTITGRKPRANSAEYTYELIRHMIKKYGARSIFFEDDNFLLFRKRLNKLGEMMRKDNLKIPWASTARVDIVDYETLKMARDMGCWQVLYGVETGSQKILDFYQKNITLEQTMKAVQVTRRAGLKSKGFIMMGSPLETEETLQETVDFLKVLPLDDISITFFAPYPGSPVYGEVEKYGTFEKNWEKMSSFNIVYLPHGLNEETLRRYEKLAYRGFYFRPSVILSYLARVKSVPQLMRYVKGGVALIKHAVQPR